MDGLLPEETRQAVRNLGVNAVFKPRVQSRDRCWQIRKSLPWEAFVLLAQGLQRTQVDLDATVLRATGLGSVAGDRLARASTISEIR